MSHNRNRWDSFFLVYMEVPSGGNNNDDDDDVIKRESYATSNIEGGNFVP